MNYIDTNLFSETDDYLIFFDEQLTYFLNYINKNTKLVYHYTSNNVIKEILKSSSFRFSNISQLNDYCEFAYLFTILSERLEKYECYYDKVFCQNLKKICSEYCDDEYVYIGNPKDIERQYYISSFSCSKDNLSLWTLYLKEKDFMGANIGLNPLKLKPKLDFSGKVIYSKTEQVKILDYFIKISNYYYEKIDKNNLEYYFGDMHDVLRKYAVFFKHPSFEQEHEYRFVYHPSITDAIKNEDGKLFIDIKFDFDNLIEDIVLSPIQSQLVEKEAIKNILKEYNIGETKITDSDIPFVKN